jgi:L-fuconolactonase
MSPDVPVLFRDYLPDDLRGILQRCGIDKTIVVQAAQTTAETAFLLELAGAHDFIAGVVGWLDLESHTFPEQFAKLCADPKFIGIRPMLQDLPDDDWILRPRVVEALKLIANADFPFDFLTYTRHLPHVLRILELVPHLRAVIDHASKPEIKVKKLEPWKTLMAEAAQHPNLYCKISGMITEADHQNWTTADLRPYVDHLVETFGWHRLMFGSDWPVCRLAGEYEQVLSAFRETLAPHLNERATAAIFGANAERFYKLAGVAS